MPDCVHSFHIPVMGTSFTIDAPIKVAMYGISSVISLVDDVLMERMRQFYNRLIGEVHVPIESHEHDSRARRITAYLDLVDQIVKDRFEKLKASAFEIGSEIHKYFELLADDSPLKKSYERMLTLADPDERLRAEQQLRREIKPGPIDVNIMTKVDRTHLGQDGAALPPEFSDALAALRGYALSTLNSAIVLSAGFNRRLYSYVEQFKDFHADADGFIKKKIILKVNDYRSAFTQGKFFAKKGLWVSEYRIESGLNCGGHAFGRDGTLLGPVLEEFKQKKNELVSSLFDFYRKSLEKKGVKPLAEPPPMRVTAQGGVGTAGEHRFLLDFYGIDGVGWGTPFLLVPEATIVDQETLERLCKATEKDLALSDVSPLGIPFNNLMSSASEEAKVDKIQSGRIGSRCRKGFLVSNMEFSEQPVCVASRLYQLKKLEQLESLNLSPESYREARDHVLSKVCLCNDLAGAAYVTCELGLPGEDPTPPAVCPGPNLANFSRVMSLQEMVDHIYGRSNVIENESRSNMFINELRMYIDYFGKEIVKTVSGGDKKPPKYFSEFKDNLYSGINYYHDLVAHMSRETEQYRQRMVTELGECRQQLAELVSYHSAVFE